MEREETSYQSGSPVISMSAVAEVIGGGITELIDEYDFVNEAVHDEDMKCGGRLNLTQHIEAKGRRQNRNSTVLPCGSCIVSNQCLLGLAR